MKNVTFFAINVVASAILLILDIVGIQGQFKSLAAYYNTIDIVCYIDFSSAASWQSIPVNHTCTGVRLFRQRDSCG
jgi:hypothetical protein